MKAIIKNINNNRIALYSVLIIIVLVAGFFLIGDDMQMLIRWDLALFCCNIAVLPVLSAVFCIYDGREYLFGRVIGLCLSSYLIWCLSSFRLVPFNHVTPFLSIIIICLITYAVNFFRSNIKVFEKYNLELILLYELSFLTLLIIATWLLGHKIPGTETERLMDYAFMVSADSTKYFPPVDSWASGESINYYYYGQYMMTYLSRISFVPVNCGYSLAMSSILALGLSYVYLIVSFVSLSINIISSFLSRVAGVISALSVMLSGNMHYVVFAKVIPVLADLFGIKRESTYWFADSTRYIGYSPLNEADRTITEFPSYSILIGDLHAHVIDIIVILIIIALVASDFLKHDYISCDSNDGQLVENKSSKLFNLFNLNFILCAFLVGISSMSNYWDFVIYFVFFLILRFFANFIRTKRIFGPLIYVFLNGAIFYVIVNIINYPFRKMFIPMFDGIGVVEVRSLPYQLVILWGLPISCVILFAVFLIKHKLFNNGSAIDVSGDNMQNISKIELFKKSDILVILISACAIGLIAIPEFIFVKDIYVNGFPRANTMFKVTYEAYILFGICLGYIFVRILSASIKPDLTINRFVFARSIKRWCMLLLLLWIFTLGYLFTSLKMWFGDFNTWDYKGLDCMNTTLNNKEAERFVVDWINDNMEGQEVILVADGLSYSDYDIIPAVTGHPTILGWMTHEWLWHNSYDYVLERQNDIREIYCGDDELLKKSLLDKYNVQYIYIGNNEIERFPDMNISELMSYGNVVLSNDIDCYYLIEVI